MSKSMSYLFVGTWGALAFSTKQAGLPSSDEALGAHPITNDVLESDRFGSALKNDSYHAFPDIVDNHAGLARKFNLTGGDGKTRHLYQLSGSLNGELGIFEWIVEPGKPKKVTHRRFIRNGKITGTPNQRRQN